MPDDEEKRLRALAKEADKGDSYYEKRMGKKWEQSRMAQLQAPPDPALSGNKPPATMESVEKATKKRKAPFMYRTDYKPEKKMTEEEEVVWDIMIGGKDVDLGLSYEDKQDPSKKVAALLRQYKKQYEEWGPKRTKKTRGEIANRERRMLENLSKSLRSAKGEEGVQEPDGRAIPPFERVIDRRLRLDHDASVHGKKESFLDYLKRRRKLQADYKQERRERELPDVPEPGSEEYYFGKEKK